MFRHRWILLAGLTLCAAAPFACGNGTSSGGGSGDHGSSASSSGSGGPASGGAAGGGSGTNAGSSSGGGSGGSDASGPDGGVASSSSGGAQGASSVVAFSSDPVIVTGVRNTPTSPATSVASLHNGGQTAVQVTSLEIGGADKSLFQVSGLPTLPATLLAGQDLPVTVQMMTTGATLPAAPTNKDLGSNLLTANLT